MKSTLFNAYHIIFCTPAQVLLLTRRYRTGKINVELIYPVALNVGLRFAIREGGRTVGAGQITELLD